MRKKITALLVALFVLTGVFALNLGTVQAKAEGETIRVWVPPYTGGDAEYTDEDFWNEHFAAFQEEHKCTVEVTILPWSGYTQKITTGIVSGEGPDVVYLDGFYDFVSAGALEELSPYFTDEEKENYVYWDMGNIMGGQYVMPMMVGNATVLYCNMDILKDAGFDAPPQTWEELMTYAKAIKEKNPENFSFAQPWGNSSGQSACMTGFMPYFWQAGGELLGEDGKPNLNTEAALKTLEFIKSFQDEGVFDDTITSVGNIPDLIKNGEAAMVVLGTGTAKSIDKAGINWDYATLSGPVGKGIWVSGDSLAVPANSPHKELAVEAMKYMLSAPVLDDFHTKIYSTSPVTKDAKNTEDPRFAKLYEEEAEFFQSWPAFENSEAFYDLLFKNIQSMFMGDLTPQQVIDNTMDEYNLAVN